MIFTPTPLPGAYLIDLRKVEDSRGFFARTWCERTFQEHGLNPRLVQCNLSYNYESGTLRGMHYQADPFPEDKLVRCTRGAIFDVIVDLRADSPTFRQWFGTRLDAVDRRMLYVPRHFAHGYQTLEPDTEVFYQVSEFYAPDHGRGIRWDDPAIGIEWPREVTVLSEQDGRWALLDP